MTEKTPIIRTILALLALLLAAPIAAQQADMSAFKTGPVFEEFGRHAAVKGVEISPLERFAVAFDLVEAAEEGRNRGLESAARFINMHVAAGVPEDRVEVAVVVHGPALRDLLTDEAREAKGFGKTNPSGAMVRALLDHGVRIIVCGQSAAASGIARADLIPGVEMELSAMTAHAKLQQSGYTLNPF